MWSYDLILVSIFYLHLLILEIVTANVLISILDSLVGLGIVQIIFLYLIWIDAWVGFVRL